jgi:membrane-bound lytic murein transglycosylase MltF
VTNAQRLVAIGTSMLAWVWLVIPCPSAAAQDKPRAAAAPNVRTLAIVNKPWTGDFDALVARRMIRVLVPYSRTLFFNDKGRERGLTAELVRDFEHYLNQKHRPQLGKRPITVYIVATTRDMLLSDMAAGLGDIAAGNLTVTEDRLKIVDFVALETQKRVSELLVVGPKSPTIGALDDLAGKRVHVRRTSSYYESLVALIERFNTEGKPPMTLTFVPDALEDEDMLVMLNAGLFDAIVVDDWKARMWGQILPQIRVQDDVVLRSGGKIGWAIRQGSPRLAEALMDFFQNYAKKQGVIEYRLAQYYKAIKQIQDPSGTAEWQRFEQTLALFEQYGALEARLSPLIRSNMRAPSASPPPRACR